MSRGRLVVVAAIVAAFYAPAAAQASVQFNDPGGDSGSGPDVTSVIVSNDPSGTVTFQMQIANRPEMLPDDTYALYFNSDRNASTGDRGDDYALALFGDGWQLSRWTGTAWEQVTTHGKIDVSDSSSGATFTINKADFGNPASFDFWASAWTGSGGDGQFDDAPNTGAWTYSLAVVSIKSIVAIFVPATIVTKGPVAGAVLKAQGVRIRLGDGSIATPDNYTCSARIGSTVLAAAGSCAWKVPKSAVRKTVVVTINVTYSGTDGATDFPFKVRKK